MNIQKIFEAYSDVLNHINLGDKENLLLIHQALYRFFAASNNEWLVLHASGVAIDGKAILFADDGTSIGKTTQSLALYKVAKDEGRDAKYITDEFILYRKGYVFPNKYNPIHCNKSSKKYFEDLFGKYEELIQLEEDEFANNPVELHAIIYPHRSKRTVLKTLNGELAKIAFKCTAYAHLIKLKHPEQDRCSIFTKTDDVKVRDITELVSSYSDIDLNVPAYRLNINNPRDTYKTLKDFGVFKKKKIKQHTSCGGVLFNESESKIYLISKKERGDWLLPKGHIEKDESFIETAIREVQEETGYRDIEVIDIEESGTIKTFYELKEEPEYHHYKTIHFYPMKLTKKQKQDTAFATKEGLTGNWFSFESVIKKMTYDNERKIVERAIAHLK